MGVGDGREGRRAGGRGAGGNFPSNFNPRPPPFIKQHPPGGGGGGSQGCRGFTAGFIARFGVGKKLRGTSDDMPCNGRGKSFHAVVQLRFFSEEALQK